MTANTLAIPELVAAVLEKLDMTSLVAAAQVNTTWANEATNIIWRGIYGQDIYDQMSLLLLGLEHSSPERRLWYTRKIRHLHLDIRFHYEKIKSAICVWLQQEGFQFPNMKSLTLGFAPIDGSYDGLYQFLRPELVCLDVNRDFTTCEPLEQIRAKAPLLRVLLIQDNSCVHSDDDYDDDDDEYQENKDPLDAKSFLRVLQAMPSVEVLKPMVFHRGIAHVMCDIEVLRYIFTRPGLQALQTGNFFLEMELFKQISPSEAILQDLRCIQIGGDENSLGALLPRIPNIEAVGLYLLPSETQEPAESQGNALNKLLEVLSRCAGLKEIKITCERSSRMDATDAVSNSTLLSLATNCRFLRSFDVITRVPCIMTDEFIETLASRLVNLQVFSVFPSLVHGLTYKSIASFARHCRYLRQFQYNFNVELLMLENEPDDVIFAELRNMEIGKIMTLPVETTEERNSIQERLFRLFDRRFPCLNHLERLPDSELDLPIYHYLTERPKLSPLYEKFFTTMTRSIIEK